MRKKMKRGFLVFCSVALLAGCWDDKRTDLSSQPEAKECFTIITHEGIPPSPILLNKCTGETWVVLYEEVPDSSNPKQVSREYDWYKMNRSSLANAYAFPKPL
jgi:hypothetical protein